MLLVCKETREAALVRASRKMQAALRRRRRGDLARALQATALREIPIPAPAVTSVEQALQDVGREPMLMLNNEVFEANEFLAALERLCAAIVRFSSVRVVDGEPRAIVVRDALLSRLSRTSSGADAYAMVVRLLGLDDDDGFVVMPRLARNLRKVDAPGVEVRRAPTGAFKARVRCVNNLAIHRFCDGYDGDELDAALVEDRTDAADRPDSRRHPPWLPIDTVVVDELDLSGSPVQSKRILSIYLPNSWSSEIFF